MNCTMIIQVEQSIRTIVAMLRNLLLRSITFLHLLSSVYVRKLPFDGELVPIFDKLWVFAVQFPYKRVNTQGLLPILLTY
jgi:hypothetical protein